MSAVNIVEIPNHISRYDQVQSPIIVVIDPSCARGPTRSAHASSLRHIGERSIAVVVIKRAVTVPGDEQIVKTIIVVIANRNAGRIATSLQPGFRSDILECPIRPLMVKTV